MGEAKRRKLANPDRFGQPTDDMRKAIAIVEDCLGRLNVGEWGIVEVTNDGEGFSWLAIAAVRRELMGRKFPMAVEVFRS
jgi:hypothetical protein